MLIKLISNSSCVQVVELCECYDDGKLLRFIQI